MSDRIDPAMNLEISDDDIYDAMKDVQGYLDVTPADLKELYKFAYRHALERMTRSVRARDIMTRLVFSVNRNTPVREVAEIMAARRISGLPVLDKDGTVAGVISEKDFLSRMGTGGKSHFMAVLAEFLQGKGDLTMVAGLLKAEDMMTSPAVSVMEDLPVGEISRILTEKLINRVPVVGAKGELTGIVSRTDVVRALLLTGGG
ncbi:MAG: CBS domain-containing protein [Nitrospirae bacterium]|nr:CBS domain-containing protein [Nitrospirota bacterium]